MPQLSLEKLTELTMRALKHAGASKAMAQATAQALVAAEAVPVHVAAAPATAPVPIQAPLAPFTTITRVATAGETAGVQ